MIYANSFNFTLFENQKTYFRKKCSVSDPTDIIACDMLFLQEKNTNLMLTLFEQISVYWFVKLVLVHPISKLHTNSLQN